MELWAHALGVPSDMASYDEYLAAFGDAAACPACDAPRCDVPLPRRRVRFADEPRPSVRRGAGSTFFASSSASFSSAATVHDAVDENDEPSEHNAAVSSHGNMAVNTTFLEVQAQHVSELLSPRTYGLYESGIDDNWCAMPVTTADDNPSYDAAMRGGEKPLWDDACTEEIENLKRFKAFKEVPESSVPDWDQVRRRAPSVTETLWVLRRKRGAENQITRYKARCVYNDRRRLNRALVETFSPAVRHTTVKASVACSVLNRRRRFSFDVTGAYLQGEYEENEVVYARPPKGHRTVHDDGSPIVWRMRVPLCTVRETRA